jgi:hypothetical protein
LTVLRLADVNCPLEDLARAGRLHVRVYGHTDDGFVIKGKGVFSDRESEI